jgi:hypothetical protein
MQHRDSRFERRCGIDEKDGDRECDGRGPEPGPVSENRARVAGMSPRQVLDVLAS